VPHALARQLMQGRATTAGDALPLRGRRRQGPIFDAAAFRDLPRVYLDFSKVWHESTKERLFAQTIVFAGRPAASSAQLWANIDP